MTRWLLTHPDTLIERDRIQLKALLANCPELDVLAKHVRTFAHMVTDLQGDQLPEWIESGVGGSCVFRAGQGTFDLSGDQLLDRIDHLAGVEPSEQIEVREGAAALHCQHSCAAHMDVYRRPCRPRSQEDAR
ncbi:hypothetical protein GCM10010423_29430 [Streptomyces levis]|uniref:Uncharacterized protein n=1 Tax=Streptomyces levis TaxID=285566 RepID=A0ABN3NSS4_9ACTN